MRRSLIVTVAATIVMVLLAMLIPMAVLIDDYAMEDRLARAALEVQATETVVSSGERGPVAVYVDALNADSSSIQTTVLYPDGEAIGPRREEDARVAEARRTGRARVDDIDGGAEILVPVSLGGTSALPEETPVVRVTVLDSAFGGTVRTTWTVLTLLGLVLLGGSLLMADRLSRSFVQPIRSLADAAGRLGGKSLDTPIPQEGPPEVREVGAALARLAERVQELLRRERESVSDLSHRLRTPITSLRLGVESLSDPQERERLAADVENLDRMVDAIVREARRSEREGLTARADVVATVTGRAAFWQVLAEEQRRDFVVAVPSGPVWVRASAADIEAVVDVLMDNVITYTPEGTAVRIQVTRAADGGADLLVADQGPGFPPDLELGTRGASGSGSTGLGLSIAESTAVSSGGRLSLSPPDTAGAQVTVHLGPAR